MLLTDIHYDMLHEIVDLLGLHDAFVLMLACRSMLYNVQPIYNRLSVRSITVDKKSMTIRQTLADLRSERRWSRYLRYNKKKFQIFDKQWISGQFIGEFTITKKKLTVDFCQRVVGFITELNAKVIFLRIQQCTVPYGQFDQTLGKVLREIGARAIIIDGKAWNDSTFLHNVISNSNARAEFIEYVYQQDESIYLTPREHWGVLAVKEANRKGMKQLQWHNSNYAEALDFFFDSKEFLEYQHQCQAMNLSIDALHPMEKMPKTEWQKENFYPSLTGEDFLPYLIDYYSGEHYLKFAQERESENGWKQEKFIEKEREENKRRLKSMSKSELDLWSSIQVLNFAEP